MPAFSTLRNCGVASAAGAGIWLLSPILSGQAEPWDAAGVFYPGALLLAGLGTGYLEPTRWFLASSCVLLGQMAVFAGRILATPGDGGLWPLGLVFLIGFSVISIAGGKLGALARARRSRVA